MMGDGRYMMGDGQHLQIGAFGFRAWSSTPQGWMAGGGGGGVLVPLSTGWTWGTSRFSCKTQLDMFMTMLEPLLCQIKLGCVTIHSTHRWREFCSEHLEVMRTLHDIKYTILKHPLARLMCYTLANVLVQLMLLYILTGNIDIYGLFVNKEGAICIDSTLIRIA